MIPYLTDAGRIKQRILCCRKFIIIFGSSDLFMEQLLAVAACRLLKFSFRAWQKFYIPSLLSLGRFSKGILINISSKKNAFVRVFTLTMRHFETGLYEGKIRWWQAPTRYEIRQLVKLWQESLSGKFCAASGNLFTDIDNWNWQSFVTSPCDVNNYLFPLDVQNEIQLLSRLFCYSWLVCLSGFWLRTACAAWSSHRKSNFGWYCFRFQPCFDA